MLQHPYTKNIVYNKFANSNKNWCIFCIMVYMKSMSLARPHAIMMVGIPGSGKSFFASKFAETFNAPYINADDIAALARDETAAGQITGMMVELVVKSKQTFIYEGNTDTRAHRTEFAKWARGHGYQPMLVWVQTDPRAAEDRSIKYNGLSAEDYDAIVRSFSPPHQSEHPVVISGRHTYASQLKVILNHLAKARPSTSVAAPERKSSTQENARNIRVQ